MATATTNSSPAEPPVTELVSGIVRDARTLFTEHVALVRAEIKTESRRAMAAAVSFAIGGAAAVPALMLLCNMLVYLLHDDAGMPMWSGDAIVGGLLAVVSAILIAIGVRHYQSFNPFPSQSVDAFKENERWMTNPK